jgi:hypothetical protein
MALPIQDGPPLAWRPVLEAQTGILDSLEADSALLDEASFARRTEALEALERDVVDPLDDLRAAGAPAAPLLTLRRRARRLQRRLEAVDEALFRRLRAEVRAGELPGDRGGEALRRRFEDLLRRPAGGPLDSGSVGYDPLDSLVNGLLGIRAVPRETLEREPDMVDYHQTPARVVFELVDRTPVTADDVFYDLGSGLGHVPILVNLLSGAASRGIEREPAYHRRARAAARTLGLDRVVFQLRDVRTANLADGTVFYLYTPFAGQLLGEVVDRLRALARARPIRVLSYGSCTAELSRRRFLERMDTAGDDPSVLARFRSR